MVRLRLLSWRTSTQYPNGPKEHSREGDLRRLLLARRYRVSWRLWSWWWLWGECVSWLALNCPTDTFSRPFLFLVSLRVQYFWETCDIRTILQSSGSETVSSAIPILFRYNFDSNLTLFTFLALPYPEYEGQEVKNTEETLFTDKELFIMIDYHHGGKELAWNNFVIPIGKEKFYQG